jgi:phosphatidylglycerophosphatase A
LGSGFYSGFIPFAPGTFGSLVALGIFFIPGFNNPFFHISALIFVLIVSIPISNKFEQHYGKDPAQCVIDEFIGMWISLLFVPKQFWYILATFIIWRILDIIKPFPAKNAEKLKGGLGIVMDDVISGIYTLIVIHFIIFLIN